MLAERLLAPVRDAKVDALLLGCTHYPFLARTISDVMGRDVVLVDSADETAFEVRRLLAGTELARDAGVGPGAPPLAVVAATSPLRSGELGRQLLGPSSTRARARRLALTGEPLASASSRARGRACEDAAMTATRPDGRAARRAPPHHLRARLHRRWRRARAS